MRRRSKDGIVGVLARSLGRYECWGMVVCIEYVVKKKPPSWRGKVSHGGRTRKQACRWDVPAERR